MKVLITGGCGFIGHHLVEHLHRHTDYNIVIIDKLSYATRGFDRFRSNLLLFSPRITIYTWDLTLPFSEGLIKEIGDINYIIHMAAETHVDNSISNPIGIMKNNIDSTINMLEYARLLKNLKEFLYFSTDEVFGPASFPTSDNRTSEDDGKNMVSYKEWDRHRPTNPYSASKSASENICLSYENTYKIPVKIINVMNVFGERQHVEKFIPKIIKKLLNDEVLDIHTDDNMKSGTRFYIHARNVADAVLFIIKNGTQGDKFNITGEREISNLEIAQMVEKIVGKELASGDRKIELKYQLINFHKDRPGHDLRYCLDGKKLEEMGWVHPVSFEQSLERTVKWTLENLNWLEW